MSVSAVPANDSQPVAKASDESKPIAGVINIPRIAVHPCLCRHKPLSKFSHFDGPNEELIGLTTENFGKRRPGKFKGSLIVPVPPNGKFFACVKEKDPRMDPCKPSAEIVYIVLHSRERLETIDFEKNLPPGIDWFIVSINAYA